MAEKRKLKTASTTWRRKIESHETFSHDSIDSLGYDWERIGNPKIEPKFPFKVYLPRKTEDVAEAVKECKKLGQELRIRSKGHSSNDLVLNPGGAVMLMQGMDQILDVDQENLQAVVQGGAISALIDDSLAPLGIGLPVIGDHRDITVGGFASVGGISPASHRFGMFIDNVLALEFVDWDGNIKRASPDDNPDDFYSLLAGLGRHGVITEVTLRLIQIDKYRTIWENHQSTTARWTSSSPARSRSSRSPAT
jgi:FAD/FMN-containing dehydrogenase